MPAHPMRPLSDLGARRAGTTLASALALAALAACSDGGGGGDPVPPTLGPLGVTLAPVLSGSGSLVVRLALPPDAAGRSLSVPWRTAELGSGATGFARGGGTCGGEVDFVAVSAGSATPNGLEASVTITLCPNATLEPDERFELQFDWNGATQRVEALIVNDAAGGLNDTGITACLDATGALAACAVAPVGQDATAGRDSRALTNGDSDGRLGFAFDSSGGCVRDRVTGLVWDNASSVTTFAEAQAAVAAANAASRCGASDWRLPTVVELSSLVDGGAAAAPRIDSRLGSTPAAAHWSGEAYAGDNRAQWVVDFANGAIAFETAATSQPAAVRPVRGGAALPVATPGCDEANPLRFADHGNGTVTDRATGLMWMQCTEGLSGAACGSGSATVFARHADALARAQTVNADRAGAGRGFADWRVPNRHELASLVLRSCERPALQRTRFPGTPALSAWSSSVFGAGFVWVVDFSDGSVGPGGINGSRVLRLVRAGH